MVLKTLMNGKKVHVNGAILVYGMTTYFCKLQVFSWLDENEAVDRNVLCLKSENESKRTALIPNFHSFCHFVFVKVYLVILWN